MTDDSQIPILQDLLFKRQPETAENPLHQSLDENSDFEIEQDDRDDHDSEITDAQVSQHEEAEEQLPAEIDPSIQELIIDEEIRMILDKHMDKAYEEIIRLLNHKIS